MNDGSKGADGLAGYETVVGVGEEGEIAVVDDERHGEDGVRASPFGGDRARVAREARLARG